VTVSLCEDCSYIIVNSLKGHNSCSKVMNANTHRPYFGCFGIANGVFQWLIRESSFNCRLAGNRLVVYARAAKAMKVERWICRAVVHDDVLGFDVAMEDDVALVAIGPNLILEKCQRLAHLQEEPSDIAFGHRLVVPGFKLDLSPLRKIA
jgi:hypothetical protein